VNIYILERSSMIDELWNDPLFLSSLKIISFSDTPSRAAPRFILRAFW